ncbi:hypothetical protein H4R18_005423 [Coemansia javaensis]|uniref:Protein arginine N-methyltransferase domain-containing protein n=1 Tax=Coemansia javaensis TaxID=2761396 RepID=A0A9W8LDD0_9FUNG|nr:hypothetical protein H4R18_005423 [Coemansia javaensis]
MSGAGDESHGADTVRREADEARREAERARREASKALREDSDVLGRDPAYFLYYSQFQHQQNMLQDDVRTLAYNLAIMCNSESLFRDRLVMDVGAGSGILSFIAVQAQSRHVYAVEASNMAANMRVIIAAAKRDGAASRNAYMADRITVVAAKVEDPEVLAQVPQVDVIVSEPIGVLLVHERMLESFVYARDKFLRPGGAMLPSSGTIHLAPLCDSALWLETITKARFWQTTRFYGVDLNPYFELAFDEYFSAPVVGTFGPRSLMSDSAQHTIDFHTVTLPDLKSFTIPVEWHINYTGVMHGVGGWFDLAFVPPASALRPGTAAHPTYMSTSPSSPMTHWQQVRLLLKQPLAVNAGQVVRGTIHMEANIERSYTISARLISLDPAESAAIATDEALAAAMDAHKGRARTGRWRLDEQVYSYLYQEDPVPAPKPETSNMYLPVDRLLAESGGPAPPQEPAAPGSLPTDFLATQQQQQQQRAEPQEAYAVDDSDDDGGLSRRRDLEKVAVRDYEADEIDSEDDEEIESDDAFNGSDEERFGGYGLSSRAQQQAARSSGDEDEDEDDDDMAGSSDEDEGGDDGAKMVDLSEMLDAAASGDEQPAAHSGADKGGDMDVSGPNDQESEDEVFAGFGSGDDYDDDDGEKDADDAAKLARLGGFVESISARAPRRRFVAEAGDGAAEDENAIGSGMGARGVALGLDDLLGAAGESGDGEGKAARELRILREQVRTMEKAAKRAGSGVAAAPVPKRLQDQMDRKVAYEQTKASVSEWQPAVNANRKAEHLSFPLADAGRDGSVTTNTLVGDGAAANDMEAQIQAILAQSGMSDEQQRQYEELELQQLSPEEIRRRQRELRMVRELMFRSERRAKRAAKIKSKTYRRILKRQKEHAQEKELERIKEDDPEMYEMLMEKMARSRAEERITLRHKNTGKWAKAMAKRAHGDADAQQALREQLDQHDALKRKIYDIGSDEEVSDYEAGKPTRADESGSDSDPEGSLEDIKSRAVERLAAEAAAGDAGIPDGAPHKALFEMKFMKNAMQRKHEQAVRDAEAARAEIEALEAQANDDDGGHVTALRRRPAARAEDAAETPGAPGRMSFGGGLRKRASDDRVPTADADADAGVEADSTSTKRVRLDGAGQISQVSSGGGHRVRLEGPVSVGADKGAGDAQNPWLDEGAASGARLRGSGAGGLDRGAARVDKLAARLREKRRGAAAADDSVLLDVSKTLAVDAPAAAGSDDDDDGGGGSDDGGIRLEHVGARQKKPNPGAFAQRELVEQAFAEDNVVEAEFAAEKDAAMELDAPKDEDLTLPGWGGWGGAGIQPKKNKIVRKAPEDSGVDKAKRLDAKLGAAIINQRMPKAANKYYATNVPFPYTTPEQYEATMQAPMGKEWNTTKAHSRFIKPRVMTKAGRIIDPLSIPSKRDQ